jgi:hypothetical protein
MPDNQRQTGKADSPARRGSTTNDDLNREDISSPERDTEHDRVRSSNDRDQELEREGIESKHNRGYDEAVRGQNGPTDPDSAFSDVDRDDTVDE